MHRPIVHGYRARACTQDVGDACALNLREIENIRRRVGGREEKKNEMALTALISRTIYMVPMDQNLVDSISRIIRKLIELLIHFLMSLLSLSSNRTNWHVKCQTLLLVYHLQFSRKFPRWNIVITEMFTSIRFLIIVGY